MSLEDRIAKLTTVMERHNELLEQMIEKGGATAPAKATPSADAKPSKPKAAADKPKKAKEPTEEDVREKFGGFFALETDKNERKRLVAAIQPILAHFGVERVSETPAENRAEVLKYADMLIEAHGEGGVEAVEALKLPFMDEDAGDGDEGDGSDVL